MDAKILKAILALDSYNRGYNQGIILPDGGTLGDATIIAQSSSDAHSAEVGASFFAVAYKFPDNSVVISYRGTDDWSLTAGDPPNAFGIATSGSTTTAQGALAFSFYNSVVGTLTPADLNPLDANITLTGHSLGGGLAGLVGSVYGKSGAIFDNMPFETAATNYAALPAGSARDAIYG